MEALTTARAIRDEQWRAYALSELAAHLPVAQKADVLSEAFSTASRSNERVKLFAVIMLHWKQVNFSSLVDMYTIWPDSLHTLARRRRAELLRDLGALAPLITHLGGPEAIAETFRAIRDVTRWWP